MSEDIKPEVIKKTQDSLTKYINKPPLTAKLLKKPPFRFLHDIVTSVMRETGFLDGLYSADELIADNIKDRDSKINFLEKLIAALKAATGSSISAKPSKIVAGLEVNKTLELLQTLAKAVELQVDNKQVVEQALGKKDGKKQPNDKKTTSKKGAKETNKQEVDDKKGPKKEKSDGVKSRDGKTKETKGKREESKEKPKDGKSKSTERKSRRPSGEEKPKRQSSVEVPQVSNHEPPPPTEQRTQENNETQKIEPAVQPAEPLVNGRQEAEEKVPEPVVNSVEDNPSIEPVQGLPRASSIQEESPPESLPNGQPETSSPIKSQQPGPGANAVVRPMSGRATPMRVRPPSSRSRRPLESSRTVSFEDPSSLEPAVLSSNAAPTPVISRPPTARPGSARARPPSARPGAPRPRERGQVEVLADTTLQNEEYKPVAVISDATAQDDDQENFVSVEKRTEQDLEEEPQGKVENNEFGEGDDKEVQGALVTQILETKRELEETRGPHWTGNETQQFNDIEWEAGQKAKRETWSKEVESLRSGIQAMTRSANPLSKLLDFLQEDLDSMYRELNTWTTTNQQYATLLHQQQRLMDESLESLRVQLSEVDGLIENEEDTVRALKAKLIHNDQRIAFLALGSTGAQTKTRARK